MKAEGLDLVKEVVSIPVDKVRALQGFDGEGYPIWGVSIPVDKVRARRSIAILCFTDKIIPLNMDE